MCRRIAGLPNLIPLPSLAIGGMFGGFPSSFYTEYHKHLPKSAPEEEYDLRSDLYVLFHYLNHTVIFGVGPHVQIECHMANGSF